MKRWGPVSRVDQMLWLNCVWFVVNLGTLIYIIVVSSWFSCIWYHTNKYFIIVSINALSHQNTWISVVFTFVYQCQLHGKFLCNRWGGAPCTRPWLGPNYIPTTCLHMWVQHLCQLDTSKFVSYLYCIWYLITLSLPYLQHVPIPIFLAFPHFIYDIFVDGPTIHVSLVEFGRCSTHIIKGDLCK